MANEKQQKPRDPAAGRVVEPQTLPRPEQTVLPAVAPRKPPEADPDKAPPPGDAPPAERWVTQAEAYLNAHHWEKVADDGYGGSRWRDPEGSAEPLPPHEIELPNREGPKTTVQQACLRPASWEYSLREAVRTQRERDLEGGASPSPLERLDRLGHAFAPALQTLDSTAEVLEECLRLDVPRSELAPRLQEYVAKVSTRLLTAATQVRKAAEQARGALATVPDKPHRVESPFTVRGR